MASKDLYRRGAAPRAEVLVAFRAAGNMRGLEEYSDAQVWEAIQAKRSGAAKEVESSNLKEPEWQVFSAADPSRNTADFELTPVAPPVGLEAFFEKVVRVERLREVRALVGFTRIDSPGDYSDPADIPADMRAPLSRNAPTWATTATAGAGLVRTRPHIDGAQEHGARLAGAD